MIQKVAVTQTDQDTSMVVYHVNSLSSITSVAGAGVLHCLLLSPSKCQRSSRGMSLLLGQLRLFPFTFQTDENIYS